MTEQKSNEVPDYVPRLHDDQPVPESTKRLLDLAAFERSQDVVYDDSATGTQHQADVGIGTFARTEGPTTSPKIPRHDNVWNRLNAAHPGLDSGDIESLMEYCYEEKSVGEASVNNYADFDPEKLKEVEAMSEVEVENFLGINPFEDSEDNDYDDSEAKETQ